MTWYRNRGFSQLLTVISVVFGAGSIVYAATASGRWLPAAAVCALSLFVYLRLARAGVCADDAGIRVVNPFRTVRVPWSQVERFTVRRHKGFPALGFARLADGTELELWGIQARSPSEPSKRVAEALAAELNERLAAERQRISSAATA